MAGFVVRVVDLPCPLHPVVNVLNGPATVGAVGLVGAVDALADRLAHCGAGERDGVKALTRQAGQISTLAHCSPSMMRVGVSRLQLEHSPP